MADSVDTTTFVSLFHHEEQAKGVVRDLINAGVPEDVIYTLDRSGNSNDYRTTLDALHVPDRDIHHMLDEIGKGAILIAVGFASDYTDRIEGIFQRHAAVKVDEALIDNGSELVADGDAEPAQGNTLGSFGNRKYRRDHPCAKGFPD